MKYDMHKLAKLVVESDPAQRESLWNAVQGDGYEGTPQQFTRDMASTLLAVWDGKASTLDQASAWRRVWEHMQSLYLPVTDATPLSAVLAAITELHSMALANTTNIQIDVGKWDPAALDRLMADVRAGNLSPTLRRYRKEDSPSIHNLPWPTPASPKAPKAIGRMIDKRSRAKGEDYEIQAIVGGTEVKWVVLDMDGTIRHPHCKAWALERYASEHPFGCPCDICCRPMGGVPISRTGDPLTAQDFAGLEREDGHILYKDGDADAPEQIKDRNGEIVLAQCRNCGKAEVELDGSHCPAIPANDNQPDPGSASYPHLMRRKDSGVWFSVGNVKAVDGGWTVDNEFGDRARFIPADGYELTLYAGEGSDDLSLDMAEALRTLAAVVEPARLDVMRRLLVVQDTCYGLANAAGWWTDLETGEDVRSWPKKHFDNYISAKLMLMVTELAEAMEGHRKGLMDDKLPHRPMLEVELADCVIRIMDTAGALNLDVAGAIVEKLAYNMTREDHKIESRKAAGGKSV